jgi:hypothetical protein
MRSMSIFPYFDARRSGRMNVKHVPLAIAHSNGVVEKKTRGRSLCTAAFERQYHWRYQEEEKKIAAADYLPPHRHYVSCALIHADSSRRLGGRSRVHTPSGLRKPSESGKDNGREGRQRSVQWSRASATSEKRVWATSREPESQRPCTVH